MDLKILLQKIDRIFGILDFKDDDKAEIDFLMSALQLALAKTAENNSDLKSKLSAIDPKQIKSGNTQVLDEFYSQMTNTETKRCFEGELKKIVDEYINQISPTLNDLKKKQVQEVWSS